MDRRTLLTTGVVGLIGSLSGCSGVFGRSNSKDSVTVKGVSVGPYSGGGISVPPGGTAALLDFFATWCAPCKPQMSVLRSIRESFDQDSLSMLSITQETDEEAVRQFWQEYEGTWPVAIDENLDASQRYDVTSIPTLIVLSADGTEHLRHVGLIKKEQLQGAVTKAIENSEN